MLLPWGVCGVQGWEAAPTRALGSHGTAGPDLSLSFACASGAAAVQPCEVTRSRGRGERVRTPRPRGPLCPPEQLALALAARCPDARMPAGRVWLRGRGAEEEDGAQHPSASLRPGCSRAERGQILPDG